MSHQNLPARPDPRAGGRRTGVRVAGLATGLLLVAGLSACGGQSASQPASSGTGAASSASPSSSGSPSSGIGDWPSFLPSPSANQMPTGTPQDPAMSYPGSPVLADLGTGRVQVGVEGPHYPDSTKVGAESVPCTFVVTFSHASPTSGRAVRLAGARFDVLDSQGGIHQLKVAKGATMPASLAPGATATVTVSATLPSGEGLLRYYPVPKQAAIAAWDYVAETD